MADTRFYKSIAILGLVTVAAASTYLLRDESSAIAAQPGGGGDPCWHVGVSDWQCPDSSMMRTSEYITSVSITVETRDGRKVTRKLPAGVDAIFLTKQSAEKFLVSYYWATNKEKAEALTRRLSAIRER